jgi:GTP-binding protein HflX
MLELERLVTTYGGLVIVQTIQKKDRPAYRTYIWQGKLNMIVEDMVATKSDILIVWNILKPAQIYNINEKIRLHPSIIENNIKIEARDKVDLILKIFDKHAQSAEAKLQIELAAIKHMGPRIFGMGLEMSKQGWSASGGAWAWRWLGETNTERMRRHLKEKAYMIELKLKEYAQMRALHRERRKRMNLPVFGIVGYTNAGKSSLMRVMCKKEAYVADKLFATLGTEVGKIYIEPIQIDGNWDFQYHRGKEALLIDTIWFIRDLPPQLIKAFASTLEDSIQSDVLLHVIDANDPDRENKIQIVLDILCHIKANQKMIYVFNKCDQLEEQRRQDISDQYYGQDCIFVSALTGEGLSELQDLMMKVL